MLRYFTHFQLLVRIFFNSSFNTNVCNIFCAWIVDCFNNLNGDCSIGSSLAYPCLLPLLLFLLLLLLLSTTSLLLFFPALKSISLNAFQQFAADTGSDDADSPQDIHFTTSMVALAGSFLNMWGILRCWLQRVQWKYGKTCWIYNLCYSENIVKLVRYIIIFILRNYVRI